MSRFTNFICQFFLANKQNRLPSRAEQMKSGEIQYCLINNDGNQMRRPKIVLGLLNEDSSAELRQIAVRNRRSIISPDQLKRPSNQPVDLYSYQIYSVKIHQTIKEYIEKKQEAKKAQDDARMNRAQTVRSGKADTSRSS